MNGSGRGGDFPLLRYLLAWTGLFCLVLVGTFVSDRYGLHLPWYFVFLVVVLAFPNVLFVRYAMERNPHKKLVLCAQSGLVVAVMYVAEILAIQSRFWDFLQDRDRLLGIMLGNVPLEEFLFYPLMLNISLYAYIQAKSILKPFRGEPRPLGFKGKVIAVVFAAACVAAGVLTVVLKGGETAVRFLGRNAEGLPVYVEGPAYGGWGVTILVGMAVCSLVFARASRKGFLDVKAMIMGGLLIYPASLVIELLGVGRGWWVYNEQQIFGVHLYILPLESIFMYAIGVVFPAGVYEMLRDFVRERFE